MVPQWIIERKRDGHALSEDEIRFFIDGFTKGDIPDYQMAAMAMAIYIQGMNPIEIAVLTDAMMHSGEMIDSSSILKPKVDKHSTGGIGDKVSLILAPLAACCGVAVPMISGRGLGITGGTLDKLEAVKGYRCDLSKEHFLRIVDECGCCITGQTGEVAPADKKLYALRDVTATVPSIALITASIMCKKMAEGIDSLVLDVKWGKGAFMKTQANARELAESMVSVGLEMDKGVAALITDMNQPLGHCAGNALEIVETLDCLQGRGPQDLMDVTYALTARMLLLAHKAASEDAAIELLKQKIDSGEAFEKFKQMMALQGADVAVLDDPSLLPGASLTKTITAGRNGFIKEVSAEDVGKACLVLGAGRQKTDDAIDFGVGVSGLAKVGDEVEKGMPLVTLHANHQDKMEQAERLLKDAFRIAAREIERPTLVTDLIEG